MFAGSFMLVLSALAGSLQVYGHRGARARLPENTLPAFEHALKAGADVIEMDIVPTADGELAVVHDLFINSARCRKLEDDKAEVSSKEPQKKIAVHSLKMAELKEYECGANADPNFPLQKPVPGVRMPSLREVFEWLKSKTSDADKKARLSVEAKLLPSRPELSLSPAEFAAALVKLIREFAFEERVIVQSFDHRVLKEVRALEPLVKLSALLSENLPDWKPILRDLKPDYVSPSYDWVREEDIMVSHELGIQVVPWTVNQPNDWEQLIGWGVDGIITDDPEGLVQYLKNRD